MNMPITTPAFAATQAPYFYRFRIGSILATIVSDGTIPLGNAADAFVGLSREEIDRQLRDNFLPPSPRLEQNILVIESGGRTIVFDTGKGEVDLPGYRTGKLQDSLRQAGIDPLRIDAVVISHAHSDHCGGCMAQNGKRHFPNAQVYMAQADYEFWTNENAFTRRYASWLDIARRNLVPNRGRMHFFTDGQEFLPGVHAIAAPGHTVGNTVFMVTDGAESLCLIGDIAHHSVLLLERPRTQFAFDTDPEQGAASRVRILGMLADQRIRTLGYHFAWPGIGYIARHGEGFKFHPEPMNLEYGYTATNLA